MESLSDMSRAGCHRGSLDIQTGAEHGEGRFQRKGGWRERFWREGRERVGRARQNVPSLLPIANDYIHVTTQ